MHSSDAKYLSLSVIHHHTAIAGTLPQNKRFLVQDLWKGGCLARSRGLSLRGRRRAEIK